MIFNIIAMGFMIRPSTIISTVGEVMTPALLVLLLVVGVTVFVSPLSDIVAPSQAYAENSALTTGLISGYQTMDVLAAIAFGGIVARALCAKNVTNPQKIVQYTISAGFVSVILLGCLYFALFYLGATSDAVAQGATNGGQIFSRYVNSLFGTAGTWIMAGIITLASLFLQVFDTFFLSILDRLLHRHDDNHFTIWLNKITPSDNSSLVVDLPNGDHVSGFTACA